MIYRDAATTGERFYSGTAASAPRTLPIVAAANVREGGWRSRAFRAPSTIARWLARPATSTLIVKVTTYPARVEVLPQVNTVCAIRSLFSLFLPLSLVLRPSRRVFAPAARRVHSARGFSLPVKSRFTLRAFRRMFFTSRQVDL